MFLLATAPFVAACGDDDDDDGFRDDPQITQLVQSLYPGARITDIDRDNSGYEVQLWLNDNHEADMYVDSRYQWLFTEIDIAWTEVPPAVSANFTQTGYTFNPREDKVERVEYPLGGTGKGTYYSIELDREPTDIFLTYDPDGTLHSGGNNNPPAFGNSEIERVVKSRYPDARITEIDPIINGYEVQMLINGQTAEMYLDFSYQWLYTEFDIAWTSVPDAVVDSFTQDGYTFNPREDDVDCIEYPDGTGTGTYYRIELDREPADLLLYYNPDGSKRT